jgi:hypothetical protein
MNVRALRRLQDALPNDPLLLTTATTLKDLDSFRMTVWNSATGFTITLPKSTGSGKYYPFGVGKTVTSGNHVAVTASGDFIAGNIAGGVTNSTFKTFVANGTSNTTVTLNGSTQGGFIGDFIAFWDFLSGVWLVQGCVITVGGPNSSIS